MIQLHDTTNHLLDILYAQLDYMNAINSKTHYRLRPIPEAILFSKFIYGLPRMQNYLLKLHVINKYINI